MAYIDNDKLLKELSTMYKPTITTMALGYDHAIADVVVTVHEQPTADVQEVKHGEWIIDENDPERDTQCSICGFVLDDWIQGALYSFCPNCGADMRKETEDATN